MEAMRFEAISMRDAIKKIKEELGKDAVIISTQEKEKVLTAGGKPQKIIEVFATAAATFSDKRQTQSPQETVNQHISSLLGKKTSRNLIQNQVQGQVQGQTQNQNMKQNSNQNSVNSKETDQKTSRQANNTLEPNIYKPNFPRIDTREKATIVSSASSNNRINSSSEQRQKDSKIESLSSRNLEKTNSSSPRNANQNTIDRYQIEDILISEVIDKVQKQLHGNIEALKAELKSLPQIQLGEQVQEIKVLLHDIMRSQTGSERSKAAHPQIENICIKLRSAGVISSIIADLTAHLEGLVVPTGETPADFYLSATIKYMLKNIKVTGPLADSTNHQEIHCLVGPTGVGKTTSIAKIAAQLKIKKSKSVGLVSMDSVRVSAADQLRIYGKILDVPFLDARDNDDLIKFVEKRYDLDAIFVDTAGRSAHSAEQIEFLRNLKSSSTPVKFHLVLSAMMKQRDLEETLRAYQFLNPASIIFTKLDESWSFGEIFNVCALFKIPISYFAVGQRVPEDLELATKERVIERILRI